MKDKFFTRIEEILPILILLSLTSSQYLQNPEDGLAIHFFVRVLQLQIDP
jgi:hypothetical protein